MSKKLASVLPKILENIVNNGDNTFDKPFIEQQLNGTSWQYKWVDSKDGRPQIKIWQSVLKPESKLWQQLKKGTQDMGVFWTRIESWSSPGVPDVHGIKNGVSFWVELKISNLKTLKSIGLSPHQKSWQYKYSQQSGNIFNLVSHPSSRTLKIFGGSRSLELNDQKRSLVPDLEVPFPVDWKIVLDHIISHSGS